MHHIKTKGILEILDKKLISVNINTTTRAAYRLVKASNVDILPVLNKQKLVGVVQETDLIAYLGSHEENEIQDSKISNIMQKPIFVESDTTVHRAMQATIKHRLTRIPVVDSTKNMVCIGIVSATDLLKEASKEH